jgi:branched-chain amino acid transport system permease protein
MSPELSNIIVGTLVLGSIYGVVGAGFVVLYRATKVLSFAQGAFMLVGGLLFYTFSTRIGIGLYPSMACAILGTAIFGWAIYRIVFARMVGMEQFIQAIATIGLASVIQMIAMIVWGADALNLAPLISDAPRSLGSITFTDVDLLTLGTAIVLGTGVVAWLRYSRTGMRMRATADSDTLAAYSRINVPRVSGIAWGIAAGLAAAGGIVYSIGNGLEPSDLPLIGLAVFPGIILGGLDSVPGAFAGGLLVALVESVIGVTAGGQWQDPIAYVILLAVLLVRPRGLLGSHDIARL